MTGWVAVNQVIGNSMSGGEQQYWTYAPLEARRDKQIPTTKNAQAFAFQLADDDSLAWYEELDKADREKEVRILRMSLPNGKTIYYAGYASFNKTPTLVRNEGAAVSFGFTINAEITAYRAPVTLAAGPDHGEVQDCASAHIHRCGDGPGSWPRRGEGGIYLQISRPHRTCRAV